MSEAVEPPVLLGRRGDARRRPRPAELEAIVADPDEEAARQLAVALLEHRVHVTVCADGAETLLQVGMTDPDVLLVSASLPLISGATIVEVLRRRRDTPIIVGIGAGDAREAAKALAAGATACVSKPYRIPEILPILQATRPDLSVVPASVLKCGPLQLDDAAHEVHLGDSQIILPLREFELLRYLMRHQDRVISQRELLDQLWGVAHSGDPSTLTVHIKRLRARFAQAGSADLIHTVRGVGYRMRPGP